MKNRSKDGLVLLVILLVGVIIGGILGDVFKNSIPILAYGKSIGMSPTVIDLAVIKLTFGLTISLNVSSIIGLIIAFVVYRRL